MQALANLVFRATDEGYPEIVHIPHSIISVCRYRQWRASEGEPRQWLHDLVVSIFTHSQGGGIAAVTVIDGSKFPLSYLASKWDYAHYHLLSYLLSYWSPGDIVYRSLMQPRNPLRMFCQFMDSLDGVTTCCGLVDKCLSEHPKNKLLPVMAGILLFNCGSFWRWIDQRARGKNVKTFLADPGSGVTRGALLALFYLFFGRLWQGGKHRNKVLLFVCLSEVAIEMMEDDQDFDAWANVHKPIAAFGERLRRTFALGPSDAKAEKAEVNEAAARTMRRRSADHVVVDDSSSVQK